jgi:hypothetical protein
VLVGAVHIPEVSTAAAKAAAQMTATTQRRMMDMLSSLFEA